MSLNQLLQRNRHLLFHSARVVHVTGDVEQLGAGVPRPSERREPSSAAAANIRRDGHCFDVGDGGGAAEDAHVGGERRLQPRLALLALQTLDQGRFLAADVGACAPVDEHVEVVAAAAGVLSEKSFVISLITYGALISE